MTTSAELKSRVGILETREQLEKSIQEIRDKANAEMKPLQDELAKLQKKCYHPGMPYNPYNGTSIGWTCPDCKANF